MELQNCNYLKTQKIIMWRMGNAGDDGAGAPDEMDNLRPDLRSSRSDTVV